jgi:TRAP-type C4-dicarboxylate transport system permease small subunit
MSALRIMALGLVAAGILALLYGGISYTRESHQARIGALELSVKDRETVNIPVWAGVAAVMAGGALLVIGNRKA